MTATTTTTAARIEFANALKAKVTAIHSQAGNAMRVWSKGDTVRIYTDGNGYLEILDGGVVKEVKRMGWGHIIKPAING